MSIDEDTKEKLQLRFLLAQCAIDEPFVETIMLEKLYDMYKEKNLKIPKKIQAYFNEEFARLKEELEKKKQVSK